MAFPELGLGIQGVQQYFEDTANGGGLHGPL